MWNAYEIADIAVRSLRHETQRFEAEQSCRGIDALSELELHPILARGFTGAQWSVLREQPYPGEVGSRSQFRERERCDLVLLESPALRLADPVAARLEQDQVDQTLFADVLGKGSEHADSVAPEQACWIEVKAVGQFACRDGVPGPNARYATDLIACHCDLVKLGRDPQIVTGMLLIVLMGTDAATCQHDLLAFGHACLDRSLPIAPPAIESLGIADHMGNTACSVGVFASRAGSPIATEADTPVMTEAVSRLWGQDQPS